MYITHNNQVYPSVRVFSKSGSVRFTGDSLTGLSELTGPVTIYADNDFEMQTITPSDFLRQEIKDSSWLLTNIPLPTPQPAVAEPVTYDLNMSTAFAVKLLMADQKPTTADEIIQCSALWEEWQPGKHTVDEIFTVGGDPWKVYQSYDNAVYPDIAPGNQAWYTFNKPLHGTTRETAREFVQPTGAHDMYLSGEWMISDGHYYRCKSDTAHSPADYADAWEDLGVDGTVTEAPKEEETPAEDTIPEFVQPTGAHDAYAKGDKVRFGGKVYESNMDNNVYSPADYPAGWTLVEG